MPTMNSGFNGNDRVFDCGEITTNPNADPIEVTWPAAGAWDPDSFHCADPPQPKPIDGLDGLPHLVWAAKSISVGSVIAASTTATYPGTGVASITHSFGLAANGNNQGLGFAGTGCGGVCCLMDGDGVPGNGTKGYALLLDQTVGTGNVQLVQINNGFSRPVGSALGSSYSLLAELSEPWLLGVLTELTLLWYSDPVALKGTYLKVARNGEILWEIVHAGGNAHVLSGEAFAGFFGVALHGTTVIYHG